jgi:ABC-type nitrate/sulfonate/bicarbonate transport systems, periplasmic components
MTFEWALKKNKINIKEVIIDTSIQFAAMSGAFISGEGDFVTLFEPTALELEKKGYGYVVASIGELAGNVPYTTYNAKKSYIEENPKVIKNFNKAINKALDFVHNSSDKAVANAIKDYFPDTSIKDLTEIVKRYRKIDAWSKTTYIEKESYQTLEKIIENSGEPFKKAPFNKIINNKYSKK